MNNDLTEKLFNFYPTLYKKAENTLMSSSFACGDGWYHLVDVLSKLLVEQSTDLPGKREIRGASALPKSYSK